ncbi:hypothetical protein NCT2013_42520 [Enterobacter sp. M4-VN]|nr:hypothetical protein NCT2013_42520 [Enterobacter sp. M4-VN]
MLFVLLTTVWKRDDCDVRFVQEEGLIRICAFCVDRLRIFR